MLHAILVTGGWALFGMALFLWVCWAEREPEMFAKGGGRWLE